MDEVLSSWKKLRKIQPHIDVLPTIRQRAEKSLRSFRNKQEYFENLISLVSRIDIEIETEFVNALERECESYWYSYVERKTYWEKALGNPPRFPSAELHGFRTLLVTEINPEIDVDMVIKQSQLLGLMKKIGDALEWHAFVNSLTLQLKTELDFHKEAQKLVNTLLEPQGKAARIFDELGIVLLDTSPNLADWGKVLVGDYNNYKERANSIQGARFSTTRP